MSDQPEAEHVLVTYQASEFEIRSLACGPLLGDCFLEGRRNFLKIVTPKITFCGPASKSHGQAQFVGGGSQCANLQSEFSLGVSANVVGKVSEPPNLVGYRLLPICPLGLGGLRNNCDDEKQAGQYAEVSHSERIPQALENENHASFVERARTNHVQPADQPSQTRLLPAKLRHRMTILTLRRATTGGEQVANVAALLLASSLRRI